MFFWKWHVKHSQFLYFWIITGKPTSPANLPTQFFLRTGFGRSETLRETPAGRWHHKAASLSAVFWGTSLRYFFEILLWGTSLRYFFEVLLLDTSLRYFEVLLWDTLRYFYVLWGTPQYCKFVCSHTFLRWDLSSSDLAWSSFAKYLSTFGLSVSSRSSLNCNDTVWFFSLVPP